MSKLSSRPLPTGISAAVLASGTSSGDALKTKMPRVTALLVSIATLGLIPAGTGALAQGFHETVLAEPKQALQDYIPAPFEMDTVIGTLEFPGGYPTPETSQEVYDAMDIQRATMLYLDMYPAMSMHGMMKGFIRDLGLEDSSHVAITADRLDSKPLILTGNTESIYGFIVLDLKVDGPTVVEVPAGLMGPLDNHLFTFLLDIGPTGDDQGQGGKYLILPPGYDGPVPDEGYFVYQSPTYMNLSFVRANAAEVGFGEGAMDFFRDGLKIYPLESGPRDMTFTNVTGQYFNTLVPEDASAFEWMQDIIDYEPAEAFGKERLGQLASLGIIQGQAFAPDERMQEIFEKAARAGVAMSRVIAFDSRQPQAKVYPDLEWESPFIGNSSSFDPDGYFNIEARTTFHFTADGITPAMAAQMPDGKGSRYQTTYKDSEGRFLDGGKVYKLTMPPDVPVALFWAVTVYDPVTRSLIQTQPYPGISSQQTPPPDMNADGTIDVYFSSEKPEGVSSANWVKVLPDRGFFAYIRYYGPLAEFNDQSWVPNDISLVE